MKAARYLPHPPNSALQGSVDLTQVADQACLKGADLISNAMETGVRARTFGQRGEGCFVNANQAP
jgi:hypothetical protein